MSDSRAAANKERSTRNQEQPRSGFLSQKCINMALMCMPFILRLWRKYLQDRYLSPSRAE